MGKKKWLKTIMVLMAIVLATIWIGSRPSKGKIVIREVENESGEKTITEKQYLGKFFNFWYGSNYFVRPEESGERVELLGEAGDSSHWVITANETKIKDLTEMSGVQFRRLDKEIYEEKEAEIDGVSGLFFKKKDGSEFLILTIKDGKLITVALTINSNDETTEQKFADFVGRIEMK